MTAIERIFHIMAENGLSAYSVAKSTGIANSTISDWKKGKGKPSTDNIVALADLFNVSTDYLLGRTEDPRPISMIDDLQDQSLTDDERQAVEAYLSVYRQNKEK